MPEAGQEGVEAMKRIGLLVALAMVLMPQAVSAGGLDKSQVPADAKWVAHLDVEALLDSQVGGFALDQGGERLRAKMAKFAQVFGFDPIIDLRSVTLFGTEHGPAQAVGLVRAKVDQEKLQTLLQANKGYERLLEGERIVHRWTQNPEDAEDDGVRHGTFYEDDLTLIARSKEALLGAVAVLEGKRASLATKDSGLVPDIPAGAFVVVAAHQIVAPAGSEPWAEMVRSVSVVGGEHDNVVFGRAIAGLDEERNAQHVRQMLQGLLSLATLRLERSPEIQALPELKEILKGIGIGGEGTAVRVDVAVAVEDVKALMRKSPSFRQLRSGLGQ
jgi:hypothetical protein